MRRHSGSAVGGLRERGVAAVEMAFAMVILLVLALNVADAGWAIAQQNAVRGAAREAARVAATQPLAVGGVAAAVCPTIDRVPRSTVEITLSGAGAGLGKVLVTAPYQPFTDSGWSFFRNLAPISATLEFRLDGTNTNPAPPWYPNGQTTACPA